MTVPKSHRSFYPICLLFLAFCSGPADRVRAQGEANHYASSGARVDVLEAIPVSGNPSLSRIHLQYCFEGFTTVWLQDVGTVAPSGDLHYAVRRDVILFRASKGGQQLASVPLKATKVEQLPPESGREFPPVTDNGSWARAGSDLISSASIGAIKQALFDGLWAQKITVMSCRLEDEGCLLSHWIRITPPTENRQVDIGLMVILTTEDPPGQRKTVSLRYLSREGYRGDPIWSDSVSESGKNQAMAWVQQRRETIFGKMPR